MTKHIHEVAGIGLYRDPPRMKTTRLAVPGAVTRQALGTRFA